MILSPSYHANKLYLLNKFSFSNHHKFSAHIPLTGYLPIKTTFDAAGSRRWYELNGFYGNVFFTCGALTNENGVVTIYYSAADTYIAVAKKNRARWISYFHGSDSFSKQCPIILITSNYSKGCDQLSTFLMSPLSGFSFDPAVITTWIVTFSSGTNLISKPSIRVSPLSSSR